MFRLIATVRFTSGANWYYYGQAFFWTRVVFTGGLSIFFLLKRVYGIFLRCIYTYAQHTSLALLLPALNSLLYTTMSFYHGYRRWLLRCNLLYPMCTKGAYTLILALYRPISIRSSGRTPLAIDNVLGERTTQQRSISHFIELITFIASTRSQQVEFFSFNGKLGLNLLHDDNTTVTQEGRQWWWV